MNKRFFRPYDYKGPKGVKLSSEEAPLYDDVPVPSVEEMVLQVMAGGQINHARKMRAYYDVDNDEIEPDDINELEPDGYDEPDYVQMYNDVRIANINRWRQTKGLKPFVNNDVKEQEEKKEVKENTQPQDE